MRFPIFIGLVFLCLFSSQNGLAQEKTPSRFSVGINGSFIMKTSLTHNINPFPSSQFYSENFHQTIQAFGAYSLGRKWKIGINLNHRKGLTDPWWLLNISSNENVSYDQIWETYRSNKIGFFGRFSVFTIQNFQLEIEGQASFTCAYVKKEPSPKFDNRHSEIAIEFRPIASYKLGKHFALMVILPGRSFRKTEFHWDSSSYHNPMWDFSKGNITEKKANHPLKEFFFGVSYSI